MSLKQFFKSRIFVKHLLISFAITLGLIFLIFISLGIYTRHGQALPVPNVLGMTEEEFSKVLRKAHLQYKITDSTYNAQIKPGAVEDQIPDPGHKVKKNRMIYLTINTITPEKVAVPRLTDISYRQAVVQLESAGLLPGRIMYEPSEFQNLVLKARIDGRNITEGEIVQKGSVIDLVLGSGERGSTSILPDLRGLTLHEAESILSNSSLSIGIVFYDETVMSQADSLKARIYRQHPSPDFAFQAESGSEVDVWLSTDTSKITKDGDKNKEDSDFF
jgi:eukaryotic-like serine/threonine-protein kinase